MKGLYSTPSAYMRKPFRKQDLMKLLALWLQPGEATLEPPAEAVQHGAIAPEPAVDPLDRSALGALASVEEGGGPEPLDVFVTSFLENTPLRMMEIALAIDLAAAEEVQLIAHGLKSSSAWLGAPVLAGLFRELEAIARAGGVLPRRGGAQRPRRCPPF